MDKPWRERIAEARERGAFTPADVRDIGRWIVCAVGEQHAAMPLVVVMRNADTLDAMPEDGSLRYLGGAIMSAVENHRFDRADSLLDAIEDRVLTLKRGAAT